MDTFALAAILLILFVYFAYRCYCYSNVIKVYNYILNRESDELIYGISEKFTAEEQNYMREVFSDFKHRAALIRMKTEAYQWKCIKESENDYMRMLFHDYLYTHDRSGENYALEIQIADKLLGDDE